MQNQSIDLIPQWPKSLLDMQYQSIDLIPQGPKSLLDLQYQSIDLIIVQLEMSKLYFI